MIKLRNSHLSSHTPRKKKNIKKPNPHLKDHIMEIPKSHTYKCINYLDNKSYSLIARYECKLQINCLYIYLI